MMVLYHVEFIVTCRCLRVNRIRNDLLDIDLALNVHARIFTYSDSILHKYLKNKSILTIETSERTTMFNNVLYC